MATTIFASLGFSSNHSASFSLTKLSTTGLTSEDTNLSFVWLENFGSGTFTDNTHVRPSLASSPVTLTLSLFFDPNEPTNIFTVLVNAPLKPARCVPPSPCGILLVNGNTNSLYALFHHSATSRDIPSFSPLIKIGSLIKDTFDLSKYFTNSLTPP